MSELASVLGLPDTLRYAAIQRDAKGKPILDEQGQPKRMPVKEFKLAPLDQLEVAAQWELYLEQCAWDTLDRWKAIQVRAGRFNLEELQRRESALTAAISGGDYGLYTDVSHKAYSTPFRPGYRKMVEIRLKQYHPDITPELVEEIADAECETILRLARTIMGNEIPNVQAPPVEGQESKSQA